MSKRHQDALAIQQGACNPSGIAHSIVEACQEMRAQPGGASTDAITGDAAVRLMVHQLAFICKTGALDHEYAGLAYTYNDLVAECERAS